MLRDLVNRVKAEIDSERKERYFIKHIYILLKKRENSEENILNLIEEACNKLTNI